MVSEMTIKWPFHNALVLVLLCCLCIANVVSEVQKEDKRLNALMKLRSARSEPLLEMDGRQFTRYIQQADRNYHVLLFLTGTPDQNCHICPLLQKSLAFISQHYMQQYNANSTNSLPLYFFMATAASCPLAFQAYSLNQVPALIAIAAHQGPNKELPMYPITGMDDMLNFKRITKWIESSTGVYIYIPTAFYHTEIFRWSVLSLALGFFVTRIPFIIRNVRHPLMWYILGLFMFVFVMSGTVFNSMRGVPFFSFGRGIQLFSHGMRSQFRAEGMIIAALMLGGGLVWILLTKWIPTIPGRWRKYSTFLFLFLLELFIMHLTAKFFGTIKLPGYPFHSTIP